MCDLEWLRELGHAGRSLITLAPECVPAGFIRALVECGIRASAGHSEASAEIVMRALDEGMTGVTHLFNAMPPLQGRAPGLVGATLAEPRLIAGLIVDGIHVDPVSVRAAFAAKGADGIALVTDAMPTVGASMETFQLMSRTISLRNGRLATAEGTLAGAHLDLATAVRNAVTLCGIPSRMRCAPRLRRRRGPSARAGARRSYSWRPRRSRCADRRPRRRRLLG